MGARAFSVRRWFAAKEGFIAEDERGVPVGEHDRNASAHRVEPREGAGTGDLDRLHHRAHDGCFIANSIKEVVVLPPV